MPEIQKRKRVFLFSTIHASFIEKDYQILKTYFDVSRLTASGLKAVFLIFWNVFFCDVVVCWFGSVYSAAAVFFARVFHKRSIVVLAGADVAALPEINYGIWLNSCKSRFLTYAFPNADLILVVAPSLKEKAKCLANYAGENIQYLPFGFDCDFWMQGTKKEKIILTVALSDTEIRLKTKGIDFLFQAADKIPEIPFYLIGVEKSLLENSGYHLPKNVMLLPAMTQTELRSYYQRASVFCQPSRSEGLPNTLCEAMACGCIPVGTDVDGIPTAIGDTGFIVPLGNVDALVDALRQALKMGNAQSDRARQRIINEFPLQRRVDGLRKAVLGIACE
jgi:glycosyltransferase involved in cell wall biosynthesis